MHIPYKRNLTADVLKGLAVLFMIQIHIFEQFGTIEANNSVIGQVVYFLGGPFCAPVFLAVMGFFLAKSKANFKNLFKRGIILFFVGLLLNICRSIHLFITLIQGKFQLNPLIYIWGVDILLLAGLSIILLAFLRLISKDNFWFYLSILLIFIGLGSLLEIDTTVQNFYLAFIIGNFEQSYFPLFPWFSYIIIGYLFHLMYQKFKDKIFPFTYFHWLIIFIITSVIVFYTPFALSASYNLSKYYHHNFTFFSWMLGFLVLYVLIIRYFANLLKSTIFIDFLSWVGENVTKIYIFQWLIIGNIATAIYRTQNILECQLWFIGIITASTLITYFYIKYKDFFHRKTEEIF